MKTFKEYIKEHPNLRTRIIKAINPMDKLRDKMDDLKKLPGKIKDKAIDKLKEVNNSKDSTKAANYLDAEELQNYTHVSGIFTANPDLVADAKKIEKLSYSEANELANFGATILHAKTIIPLFDN